MSKRVLAIGFALVLVLGASVTAAAQDEPPPCEGETVSGTIVGVDEESGTVTLYTGEGLCTASLGQIDHPVAALLGAFLGDVELDDLSDALSVVTGCATQDEEGTWHWTECDGDAVSVTVIGKEDGTFLALTVEGEVISLTVEDPSAISEALDTLMVEWDLENGAVVLHGEQILEYHQEGLGFGVLVKLYAMAEVLDVSVDDLVAEFQAGTGMGELFQEYGRPSALGVGHIRHQRREGDYQGNNGNHFGQLRRTQRVGNPEPEESPPGPQNPGVGNAWGRPEHPGRGRNK